MRLPFACPGSRTLDKKHYNRHQAVWFQFCFACVAPSGPRHIHMRGKLDPLGGHLIGLHL